MKTACYTFTTWNSGAMAAGFDGAALVRQPQRSAAPRTDNVIDLAAWRAANPELTPREEEQDWAALPYGEPEEPEEPELSIPAPRPRKSRRAAVLTELISTASVAAAALAIILRVVAF